MTFVETALIVVFGILARFLIAVVGLALIVACILTVIHVVRAGGTLRDRLSGVVHAGHLLLRRGFYYAPGHTWLKEEGIGAVRVGLDDLAQRLLTGARAIRIAEPGKEVHRGDTLAEVTLDGRTARIAAPVDGTVVDVNDRVTEAPELVQRDPYGRGWLALLAPADVRHRSFRTGNDARVWLEREDRRLVDFFEQTLGTAAADGGEFLLPPPALLKPEQWDRAVREFLEV